MTDEETWLREEIDGSPTAHAPRPPPPDDVDDLAAVRGIVVALLLSAAFVVSLAVGYGLAWWLWP